MHFPAARHLLIFLQCTLILAGLLIVAFRPPASGRILLIPVNASDEALLIRVALDHNGLLIGPGPLSGSLIVQARLKDLADDARSSRILMMAAPSAGCGPGLLKPTRA